MYDFVLSFLLKFNDINTFKEESLSVNMEKYFAQSIISSTDFVLSNTLTTF